MVNSGEALRSRLLQHDITVKDKTRTGAVFLKYFTVQDIHQVIYDDVVQQEADIVDGIRLFATYQFLRERYKNVIIIYIDMPAFTRRRRLIKRETSYFKKLKLMLGWPLDKWFYRVNSQKMKEHATYIVDNARADMV